MCERLAELLNETWFVSALDIDLAMVRLAKTIHSHPNSVPYRLPFSHHNYLPENKPPKMKADVYRRILTALQILQNMRYACLTDGCVFTDEDIRKYMSVGFVTRFELWQVAEYQIFGMEYPPEYYSFLLNEKTVPPDPPPHLLPIRVTFDIPTEEIERMASELL